MSVWKEIRCDAVTSYECESDRNDGPQGFEPVGELNRRARKYGWRIVAGEAICPACLKANDHAD